MAKITGSLHTMIKGGMFFREKIKSRRQNQAEVLVDNLAVSYRHNVVEATSFVHTKGQGAILKGISKGKFHLVSIFEEFRTCLDPLKFILTLIFDGVLHKLLHLSFLECKLFLIRKILIGTSSTFSKMRAWTLYLKW